MSISRRSMIAGCGPLLLAPSLAELAYSAEQNGSHTPHIATNTYPWQTFARREGQSFHLHTDGLLNDIASTQINGYEPIINSPDEFTGLKTRLENHGLKMRSIYVNSTLHDASKVEKSIEQVIEISKAAKSLGTEIVVTNPSPIRWGGPEDKSDTELRLQAKSLDSLGASLKKLGITLAYHNHDAELRQGGREFHHMLTATDPANVKLCLDAHWIYRGCGDSEVAVFDALSHYHNRIVELHLRQSTNGVWQETFSVDGDINYQRLFDYLHEREIQPHLVLEQAVESASPKTMTAAEAHRESRQNLRESIR